MLPERLVPGPWGAEMESGSDARFASEIRASTMGILALERFSLVNCRLQLPGRFEFLLLMRARLHRNGFEQKRASGLTETNWSKASVLDEFTEAITRSVSILQCLALAPAVTFDRHAAG